MTLYYNARASMHSARGRKIGRIGRVVIDPATGAVTHLVVKKGRLAARDKVVPVDQVAATTAGRLHLKRRAGRPAALPEFEQRLRVPVGGVEDFQRQKAVEAAWRTWFYTRHQNPWWQADWLSLRAKPLYREQTRRHIPADSVPVKAGLTVVDKNGEPVGTVAAVAAAEDKRVILISISCRRFNRAHKRLPVGWVRKFSEKAIRLAVGKQKVESLPCRPFDGGT